MDWFLERARALGVEHAAPEPIVKGRHLIEMGVAPGPAMGALLKQIYENETGLPATVGPTPAAPAPAASNH